MPALEATARILVRGLIAAFTAAVLVLFQSCFWTDAVTVRMHFIMVAIALAAYFRPPHVLILLGALLPVSGPLLGRIGGDIRTAEALVLAFLAGALVRGWTLHRFREFPSNQLHLAAVLFGCIVAASCIEQLRFIQIQRDFPAVFVRDLFSYINFHYLSSFRGLGTVFHAMLLLEGVGLLLYTAHYGRRDSPFIARLGVALVAGAVGAATVNLWFFTHELAETGQPRQRFIEFFMTERWSANVGDVNAAGAYFCMALFAALALAFVDRRRTAYALPIAALMSLAMWLSGSRTAITIAAVLAAACVPAALRSLGMTRRAVAIAGVVLLAGGVVAAIGVSRVLANREAVDAVKIRGVFLGVTARMLESQPLFGLGVGQYSVWSRSYMPVDLQDVYYARENAHNNFAQIAGELGLIGLTALVWLLGISLAVSAAVRRNQAELAWPVLLGVVAFIATWAGNHPLLVPAVAFPFWLALGLAAAFATARPMRFATTAAAACVVALAASVPLRVERKLTLIDLTDVTYGLSDRRVMGERARFFVPGDTARVILPLRARSMPERPFFVEVTIDGSPAATARLGNDRWTEWTLDLPAKASGSAYQIDLRLDDPAESAGAARQGYRIDVGEWSIIPRPHG